MGEGDADQHEGAGEQADEGFGFHEVDKLTICAYTHLLANDVKRGLGWGMGKKPRALSEEALEEVARRFAVLSEPMRLRLIHALFEGERSVGDLVESSGGTQANVSRHLQHLANAGVLKRRKEGLQVFYAIGDPSIFQLCELVCGSLEKRLAQQAGLFRHAATG